MYGKFFASTFTGSMYGAGPTTFAVWGYVIANAVDGTIELNPALLAHAIGTSSEDVDSAIEALCAPDPRSRSQAEGGRRLVRDGTFQYRVVNHAHYRNIRDEEDRRAYNREAKQRERARKRASSSESLTNTASQQCQPIQKQKQIQKQSTDPLPNGRELPGGNAPALFPDADGENPATIQDASFRAVILKDLWNARTTAPLPKCLSLSKGRTTKAKTRLVEHGPEWWAIVIDRIQASDFCRGKNDRGWLASFDWLVSSQDPGLKVLEGKYDNRAPVTGASPRLSDDAILADIAAQKALRQVRR